MTLPDRIGIDQNGYGWRAWDDEDFLSMVPQNPDNSPIPGPINWYYPAGVKNGEWAALCAAAANLGAAFAEFENAKDAFVAASKDDPPAVLAVTTEEGTP